MIKGWTEGIMAHRFCLKLDGSSITEMEDPEEDSS